MEQNSSTIIALLPSMLAFAPIVTARIGLLSNLSHCHGVIAAGFTFGLPVEQLEVITARSVTSVKHLLRNVGDAKRLLGTEAVLAAKGPVSSTNPSVPPVLVDSISDLPATANAHSLLGATSISSTDSPEMFRTQQRVGLSNSDPKLANDTEDVLSAIKQTAFGCNRPSIRRVQAMMFLFTVGHSYLAGSLLAILLLVVRSSLIWDCRDAGWWTVGLLQGVFCLLGPLRMRFERKYFAATDIIHISKASNTMGTNYWSRLRDPHPMVVILRPSPTAFGLNANGQGSKGLRVIYLIGVSQLFWILFLSFFFSSLVGASIFWSLVFVSTFVLTVAMSRGLSILTVWLVEKYIGLQVIEYDDSLELEVMRRLIGALPEALVEVKGNPNTFWEKCYLQGQSMGYGGGGLEVNTSSIFIPAREAIPMLFAVVTVISPLMSWGWLGLTFGLMCLVNRKEKCIVLCNRGADADQA